MFKVGDKVWIEASAKEDIGYQAFHHIMAHPYATVKGRLCPGDMPEEFAIYNLEWPEPFAGGWDCNGDCAKGQGQQVTSKHLSLDFEGSRKVITVPHLEGPMEY